MRTLPPLVVAALLALALLPGRGRGDQDGQAERDEQTLREAGVDTDGPALLAYLRKHTTTDGDAATIRRLIRDLGDDLFRVRERATARLMAVGERAVPFLRTVEAARDPEVACRARRCLREIRTGSAEALLAAAARLVAVRRPPGAARALLDYVPFAEKEDLARQVREALAALAVSEGKADPVLVEALGDRVPARRAAAGVALARAGAPGVMPAVRKLLKDP